MRHEVKVTPAHVKAEAARRIEQRYPIWRQMNVLAAGGASEMTTWIDQVRIASNLLEAQSPIPPDYTKDHHWPEN